ncbi:hypothetical protein [Salana multivorans]
MRPTSRAGAAICTVLALLYLASLAVVLTTAPGGVTPSADENAQAVPL